MLLSWHIEEEVQAIQRGSDSCVRLQKGESEKGRKALSPPSRQEELQL